MNDRNRFSRAFLASFLASLSLLIAAAVSGVINKHSFRHFINVYSKKETGNLKIPVIDMETDKISRGILSRDETNHMTKETIQKDFTFAEKTHAGFTAKACGNLDIESKQEKIAYVIVRIFIDGVRQAEDSMEVNHGVLTRLAASTTETVEFAPGTYEIKVESVFYGPVRDVQTSLSTMMFTKKIKKLKQFLDY